MSLKKSLTNIPSNASAWSFDYTTGKGTRVEGISVGLYDKPNKKTPANPAYSLASLIAKNGTLTLEVNVKRLREAGGTLNLVEEDSIDD